MESELEGKTGPASLEDPETSPAPAQTKKPLISSKEQIKECIRIEPALVPIKLFYLTFIGGIGCVLPYVAVFLKQLGLSPQQIGLISGVRPIVGFISGPVWGMLGDRFNIRRLLLLISISAWLAFYVGFYFIPAPKRSHTCPWDVKEGTKRELLVNNASLEVNGTNPDLSSERKQSLIENIGWIYDTHGVTRVLVMSLFVIVGGEFFQSPTTALSDAGTLQTLGPKGLEQYGAQRAWGAIGWGAVSLLGGAVVSQTRQPETICGIELHFSDYRILAYVFIGFMVLAFVAAANIRFKNTKEEKVELNPQSGSSVNASADDEGDNNTHDTLAVLRLFINLHYGSWITTAFCVGVFNGVIWGFLFWHLENLGADQLLMGIDSVVTCTAEFIAFMVVGPLIRCLGHMGVMYMGLVGYGIRFLAYAMINDPWLVLPAEVLQGVTFSCIWVSLTAYTAVSVPSASLATVQGILHGVYFGLGNGTGHLIGGLLIGAFGAKVTFFGFSGASFFVLILFIIAQQCSTKPTFKSYGYTDLDKQVD